MHALAIHHLNPFDLVSDKVVACNQCTDVCFVSAVVEMGNYCVEAIHCVIGRHEGYNAMDQLKPTRPCLRRGI